MVINMEKIFYNGQFPFEESGHNALYTNDGAHLKSGYLNDLKKAHPKSVMIDLNNAFIFPCAAPTGTDASNIGANILILNENPFSDIDSSKIKILEVYQKGEPLS